jgi:ferredoxin
MAVYVIAEPCGGCKDQGCVSACPVDCIREGSVALDGVTYDQLYINANECICCGMCETECPVDAIYPDDELPDIWQHFAQVNKVLFR